MLLKYPRLISHFPGKPGLAGVYCSNA